MNREIKFRAWLKDEKEMVDVKSIELDTQEITYIEIKGIYQIDLVTYMPFEYIELMQYVGLKDKNGVDIYEGDIVKTYSDDTYVVYFDERSGAFGLITSSPCEDRKWFDDISNMVVINNSEVYKNLEVISNIYENKELLGED